MIKFLIIYNFFINLLFNILSFKKICLNIYNHFKDFPFKYYNFLQFFKKLSFIIY